MECPYCGAELIHEDEYGYFSGGSMVNKLGDIYRCPNCDGFESTEDAFEYRKDNSHLEDTPLDEVACDSAMFNGFFYTDKNEELYEGYPC